MSKCRYCQTEIPDKAKRCPHCQGDLRSWFRRHPIWTAIFGFILLTVLINSFSSISSSRKIAQEKNQASDQPATNNAEAFKQRLQKEISGLKNFKSQKDSVDNILFEVGAFSAYASLVNEAKSYDDTEIKRLTGELERQVSQLQIKEFPLMRKAYGVEVNKALWIENAEAYVFGDSNTTIEFVSGLFASNKAIAQMHGSSEETLKALRFKRARYKWVKSATEGTYYDIVSLPDSQLVEIKIAD